MPRQNPGRSLLADLEIEEQGLARQLETTRLMIARLRQRTAEIARNGYGGRKRGKRGRLVGVVLDAVSKNPGQTPAVYLREMGSAFTRATKSKDPTKRLYTTMTRLVETKRLRKDRAGHYWPIAEEK